MNIMNTKRTVFIASVALLPLLVVFIAMQLSNEVDWTSSDFLIAALLLILAAFSLDAVVRKVKDVRLKFIWFVALIFITFLVWVELAVGIFGTPFSGN